MQKKTIILVTLLALVLVGMLVAVFVFRGPMRAVPTPVGAEATPAEPINENDPLAAVLVACDSQERPDGCRDAIRFEEAVKAGEAAYCSDISIEESRNTCFELVAFQTGNQAVCDSILVAQAKDGCVAHISERAARENPDVAPCAPLVGERRLECLMTAFGNLTGRDLCDRYPGDDKNACLEYFDFRHAANARDLVACEASAGRFRTFCTEYVPQPALDPTADPDGDGLTNAEEIRYRSNPLEADSDSDGYPDAEEVKNGYNPNGPGKLP